MAKVKLPAGPIRVHKSLAAGESLPEADAKVVKKGPAKPR